MKFIVKNNSNDSVFNLMRRAGYHFWGQNGENDGSKEINFIRPVGGATFPRFHVYLKENPKNQEMVFNLHLDQRRTIYKGAPAHKGEYDGELLGKEKERIEKFLK